ncbi:MAG TPA: 1-(5-phosphoribosyl)-5-[(5-phosphoribosylamino)methylideneamino]imidazole-4-carboxamide isomerase [Cyclobacteriaceae bacterium]|nr:1-(5-phosphoribosyl)-5-[(5-phosphoribosylamino)methylideneamino]imidazole-4-carboxamide isomerase [Cyclobacteriaceae bacterium]
MKIIAAIDIMDGKCVRLTQGNFGSVKVYDEDPVDMAKKFEDADLENIHIVDLDGAQQGAVVNWQTVEDIRANTALRIDFGGGVKTTEDVEALLDLNIDRINVGSVAVREPEKFVGWIDRFGSDNFILSTDVKGNEIKVNGWQEQTGITIFDIIKQYEPTGIKHVTCTDISADGTLAGPNFALYKKLLNRFPGMKFTASGGVSSMEDLENLKYIGVYGVIIGKAIYEGKIPLSQLAAFNR